MACPLCIHRDGHGAVGENCIPDQSMEEMRGASFAGSSPPFLVRERAAVDVDICPERRSPRYHETCLALENREGWFSDDDFLVGEKRASRICWNS